MLPASAEPSLEGGEPQSPIWGHWRALCQTLDGVETEGG